MEEQCSPLTWIQYHQEEGLEGLKHSLLYTTLELENTIVSAREEISRRENDLINLKDLLQRTTMERDEAKQNCQKLEQEKLVLQKQLEEQNQLLLWQQEIAPPPLSGTSASTSEEENESIRGSIDELITMQPPAFSISQTSPQPPPAVKPLPEKGQLLKAVMEAGPLLKTLLLAAPLPQWQHPPPQLKAIEIPPVIISPTNKRSLGALPEFSPNKYQRIHQS